MSDTDVIVVETILATFRHNQRTLSGAELKVMANATARQVRSAISVLRRGGWLIVGNWRGYRFAHDETEVEEIARKLEEQAMSLQQIAATMRVSAQLSGCFVYDRRGGGDDGVFVQGPSGT